jgi:hypothetical protein
VFDLLAHVEGCTEVCCKSRRIKWA